MKLQYWKLVLLAPLTLTVLTACPEHTRSPQPAAQARPNGGGGGGSGGGIEQISPYTGYWIAEDAIADYKGVQGDAVRFCSLVQRDPRRHGANFAKHPKWRGQVHPTAWRITKGGNVYDWLPSVTDENIERQAAFFAWIADSGFFSIGDDRTAVQTAASHDEFRDPAKSAKTGRMVVTADPQTRIDHLQVWKNGDARHAAQGREYRRTSPEELQDYALSVQRCFSSDDQNYDQSYDGQAGPQPQAQTPSPVRSARRRSTAPSAAPVIPRARKTAPPVDNSYDDGQDDQ